MKKTIIFLALASLIWTFVTLIKDIFDGGGVNFVEFVSVIPAIVVLYSEIDWIYIKWNKLRAYFSANTISFSPKYQFVAESNTTILDVNSYFKEVLSKLNYKSIDKKSRKNTHQDLFYVVRSENGIEANIEIKISPKDYDKIGIILKFDYQISYRDAKEKWEEFEKIRNMMFAKYSIAEGEKQRYEVSIQTSKTAFNPFYRLTVRHLGGDKIDKFNLTFRDGDLKITSTLHQIYGVSENPESIKKMINEYIPLSKIL